MVVSGKIWQLRLIVRIESRSRVTFASRRRTRAETIEAERIRIVDDGRSNETAGSRGGATCVRRFYVSAASNDASRAATCQLRFVNVRGACSRATNARAVFAPNDAALETLRRKLRKMLIGRWKSKDKSSSKSSSGSGGAGKKKRKFGREGKKPTMSTCSLASNVRCSITATILILVTDFLANSKSILLLVTEERLDTDRKNLRNFKHNSS